jgi:hypothetical protein
MGYWRRCDLACAVGKYLEWTGIRDQGGAGGDMKNLISMTALLALTACAMTPEEAQMLNASIQNLGQSAQGWQQQFSQQGQYVAPHAATPAPYSGGVTYRQVGDSLIGSNGVSYRKVGNTIVGSDGTTCQVVGQQLLCRY